MNNKEEPFVFSSFSPPDGYDPPVLFERMIQEKDVMVEMRDGARVSIDIYRPDTGE